VEPRLGTHFERGRKTFPPRSWRSGEKEGNTRVRTIPLLSFQFCFYVQSGREGGEFYLEKGSGPGCPSSSSSFAFPRVRIEEKERGEKRDRDLKSLKRKEKGRKGDRLTEDYPHYHRKKRKGKGGNLLTGGRSPSRSSPSFLR